MSFPFADSALYSFTIINYNREDDSMLSPVSPPSESLNPEGVSGTSQNTPLGVSLQN